MHDLECYNGPNLRYFLLVTDSDFSSLCSWTSGSSQVCSICVAALQPHVCSHCPWKPLPINVHGAELPTELWRRLSAASGDRCKTHFIFQHLSICVQRHITTAFTGTFLNGCENLDEAWFFRDKSFSVCNLMFCPEGAFVPLLLIIIIIYTNKNNNFLSISRSVYQKQSYNQIQNTKNCHRTLTTYFLLISDDDNYKSTRSSY